MGYVIDGLLVVSWANCKERELWAFGHCNRRSCIYKKKKKGIGHEKAFAEKFVVWSVAT